MPTTVAIARVWLGLLVTPADGPITTSRLTHAKQEMATLGMQSGYLLTPQQIAEACETARANGCPAEKQRRLVGESQERIDNRELRREWTCHGVGYAMQLLS